MIVGLISPDTGNVTLNNKDVFSSMDIRKKIGYVPTESFFYEKLSVVDNLKLVAHLYGVTNFHSKLNEIIKIVGINSYLHSNIEDLSTGMKKMVAFTSTLLIDAELLVLDEPFNALDLSSISILNKKIISGSHSLIFTSHIPDTVYNLAEKIIVLKDGTVAETVLTSQFDNLNDFSDWMKSVLEK